MWNHQQMGKVLLGSQGSFTNTCMYIVNRGRFWQSVYIVVRRQFDAQGSGNSKYSRFHGTIKFRCIRSWTLHIISCIVGHWSSIIYSFVLKSCKTLTVIPNPSNQCTEGLCILLLLCLIPYPLQCRDIRPMSVWGDGRKTSAEIQGKNSWSLVNLPTKKSHERTLCFNSHKNDPYVSVVT